MHTLIHNYQTVIDWFGHLSSFHDAEVLRFCLFSSKEDDQDSAEISVYAFELTNQTQNGHYVTAKHANIVLKFDGIGMSQLEGWNHQNTLFGIRIEQKGDDIVMFGDGSFGVEFTIGARSITVASLTPSFTDPGEITP